MPTRENVYELAHPWADPILWYARGVKAMQAKPLADPTSWRFYAAVHGYQRFLWDLHGITLPGDAEPPVDVIEVYFDQCQHQSWFFLPWHRGYLYALERQIRQEIAALGGPHETWALPYWNYLEAERGALPPAFRSPDWPDGMGNNPLFVSQRWGRLATASAPELDTLVHVNPMSDREFSGPGNGGSTGFGGRPTGFSWNGGENGGVEWQPHNIIHTLIGGSHPTAVLPLPPPNDNIRVPGLMTTPGTAALDPIFYLHHCNIDRLWESWNVFPEDKIAINPNDWRNPGGENWREGPAFTGDRAFAMPNTDGSRWDFVPRSVERIEELNYAYADLVPGAAEPADALTARMSRLGRAAQGGVMASEKIVERMGSIGGRLTLSGAEPSRRSIRLDPPMVTRMSESFSSGTQGTGMPDRVFLNLENVRSRSDAILFEVHVGPVGASAETGMQRAGTVSLFGTALASASDARHAGNGITHVIEITDIVDRLHLDNAFGPQDLEVVLSPIDPISEAAPVEIGDISLYRQSE